MSTVRLKTISTDQKGNHHLGLAVAILTAVLAALAIYVIYYTSRPDAPASESSTITLPQAAAPRADTPTARTSFEGTVREIDEERIIVRTAVMSDGFSVERFMIVRLASDTSVASLGAPSIGIPDDSGSGQPSTPAGINDIRVGTTVRVTADQPIDDLTSVTARQIDIISQPASSAS